MLRTILILATSLLLSTVLRAQHKIGDNTLIVDPASILELESTSKGFLPSRMTTIQRNVQTDWDEGHIIYNTTENCLQIYNGSSWDCFAQGVIIDSTIYKYNGTLTSNRTISMDTFQLTFDGSGDVVITDAGFVGIGDPTPDAKLDVEGGTVRLSDYGTGTNSGSESYLLGVDSDGDVIEISPAIDTFFIVNDTLKLSLKSDREAFKYVDLAPYLDNQTIDSFALTGNTLALSLEGDGEAPLIVDLSGLQDGTGTDDQEIDSLALTGTTLEIGLESDANGLQTVDLSGLQDGTGTDDQKVDSFALTGNLLAISLEGDAEAPLTVDLSTITGSSENIYNTSDSLEAARTVTMDGNSLTFDGTGTGDIIFQADGDVGIGTTTPSGDLQVTSDEDQDAFNFTQATGTTGEKDVLTIEDQDAGDGTQDESSVLKVVKSGAINSGDNGFSLVELANTGADPGASKYWISGRKTDEGAPLWGVDITDNDFWSEGGIVLGVTGADGGTYSGGNFIVEPDGDVGIGTTTPGARLEVDGGSVIFDEYGIGTYNDTSANYILATDTAGAVVELNTAANTRWFYPPPVIIDASSTVTSATYDVHAAYIDQFTNSATFVKSPGAGATLPVYAENELGYFVTFYDDTILDNVSISNAGVLTYDIIAIPDDNYTVITIVFEIL